MTEKTSTTPEELAELAGTWDLDPSRTTVQFTTKALWITTVKGTLRATEGTGTVGVDGRVTGRVEIDAGSIDTNNKRRDQHLRDTDFFDVQTYPTMVFDVTEGRLGAPGEGTVEGTLSLHGVSRPVELQAALRTESSDVVFLDIDATIDRSEWGLHWTKMGAGLSNAVTIRATFVRR